MTSPEDFDPVVDATPSVDETIELRKPERPAVALNLASVVSKYRIVQEIARGGMGIVYRGVQESLGRDVALKFLQPGCSQQRFIREARVLGKVASPHVVAVHELIELKDGRLMLVMEWIEGEDLSKHILRAGKHLPLDESTVRKWMEHTCCGMLAAEEQGIIHRDLKPSNILIDGKSNARVADFGLARSTIVDDALFKTSGLLGTPHYMAPEQAEDPKGVDVRSDIYSFGATFYHALTGVTPFTGETPFVVMFMHKTELPTPPRAVNPKISPQTAELLERCMAKRPADRFQSFAEILPFFRHFEASARDIVNADLTRHLELYRQRKPAYLDTTKRLETTHVYQLTPSRRIVIEAGDITKSPVDAIVSSDDAYLTRSVGNAAAINRAAWNSELANEINRLTPVRPGRAVVTSAGRLKPSFILHGVTHEMPSAVLFPAPQLIIEILHSCFYHADSLYIKSIAVPLIGFGLEGFDREQCLDTMFRFLCKNMHLGVTAVNEARIVLYDPNADAGAVGFAYSEQQFMAQFVRSTFRSSGRQVFANGGIREVFVADGFEMRMRILREEAFVVLDEQKGVLEVFDERPLHLGSIQLTLEDEGVRIGDFKRGVTCHFAWVGR